VIKSTWFDDSFFLAQWPGLQNDSLQFFWIKLELSISQKLFLYLQGENPSGKRID